MTDTLFEGYVLTPIKKPEPVSLKNAGTTPCQESPDLFAPLTSSDLVEAKTICGACPLKMDGNKCLKLGRKLKGHGVWGGEFLVEGKVRPFTPPVDDDDF